MNEDLTTFIIKELGKPLAREEIVRRVCKKGRLNWKDAERLVILIEARHNRTSTTRPAPLLFFLSIGLLFVGIGLLAYDAEILFALFQKDISGQILNLRGETQKIIGLFTGLGMTIGGVAGLWKALGIIFPG